MDAYGAGSEHGDRLLAQRSLTWKLACSAWVLLVAVGFVMFSILGWAWGAVLSRSKRMWLWTLMWGVLYAVAVLAIDVGDDGDIGVVLFIAVWMGSIGHAAYLGRGVLRTRAMALATDQGWRESTAGTTVPTPTGMSTIPMPDGVARMPRDLRDSDPGVPPRA